MDEEIPMKQSRFTEGQILGVLRQAKGVSGVCRGHGSAARRSTHQLRKVAFLSAILRFYRFGMNNLTC